MGSAKGSMRDNCLLSFLFTYEEEAVSSTCINMILTLLEENSQDSLF